MMKRVLACCALLALFAASALSQTAYTTYAQVEDWTMARFFDDLDASARKSLLAPVLSPLGIDEARFYVCLDGLNIYPDTRRLRVKDALKECVGYAKTGR